MKKFKYILLFVIMLGLFGINVDAASVTKKEEGDVGYTTFAAEYNKFPSFNITNDNQEVIVYGKSVCTSSGCSYTYQGVNTPNIEDLLSRTVKCSNGNNNIKYINSASGGLDFKESTNTSSNGTIYWNEAYLVSCVQESTGNDVVTLNPTGNQTNQDQQGNQNTETPGFNSGTTVEPSETGVETYYIVLGLVAVVSYVFMIIVKKYNLFKNI